MSTKRIAALLLLSLTPLAALACGGAVDVGTIGPTPTGDGGTSSPGIDPVSGEPCARLHGKVTLGDRNAHGWPACAFSFALGTQDANATRNLYELYYEGDLLMNELSAGDGGWIVDLGDVALGAVPKTVDPSSFPTGNWGKHDALQAYANHTYYQRVERAPTSGAATTVAAFRIVGFAPGDAITIEWIRSSSTKEMVVPTACLK